MYTISKVFAACCSHVLTKVPPGHPCGRLHGHNYEFEFVLADRILDERGFVFDYRDLDSLKTWIDQTLDHRHLNEACPKAFGVSEFEPTAENLARALFDKFSVALPQLTAVRVRETPKTLAMYQP